jgi:hypothetical protein
MKKGIWASFFGMDHTPYDVLEALGFRPQFGDNVHGHMQVIHRFLRACVPHVLTEVLNVGIEIIAVGDALPHTVDSKCVTEPMAGWFFAGLSVKRTLLKDSIKYPANRGVDEVLVVLAWEKIFPFGQQRFHRRVIFFA